MAAAERKALRKNPHLYQVNARVFVRRLSDRHGKKISLLSVPDGEWGALKRQGFDLIWLMGVWERSPAARRAALAAPDLCAAFGRTLPGWTEKDVAGSPYAVHSYRLDPVLGRPGDLAKLKRKLNGMGLRLMLDFVPNHLAMDHPWTLSRPARFVGAGREQALAYPGLFFRTPKGRWLAHGKDPYFPPWTDTVQVNYFFPEMRTALVRELVKVSEVADAVRCDMSMLALNEIFRKGWEPFIREYPLPEEELWSLAIPAVKERNPDFVFMAEVYWGLEERLQRLGFDFTYDKDLYDRLLDARVPAIKDHLKAGCPYVERSAHFTENHDEKRAMQAFGPERSFAAAAVASTLPGLRFFHDGQLEGKCVHLPIQLVREPNEILDGRASGFYGKLLAFCDDEVLHRGEWVPADPEPARAGDETFGNLLCCFWAQGGEIKVVLVNYSASPARGMIRIPSHLARGQCLSFSDRVSDRNISVEMGNNRQFYFPIEIPPWGVCLLSSKA